MIHHITAKVGLWESLFYICIADLKRCEMGRLRRSQNGHTIRSFEDPSTFHKDMMTAIIWSLPRPTARAFCRSLITAFTFGRLRLEGEGAMVFPRRNGDALLW